MKTATIRFNETSDKWELRCREYGDPDLFDLGNVQGAIDYCDDHGYSIVWL